MDPSELVALIATLNPENTPGRLAVIVRMGAVKLREKLPALIEAVQQAGQVVAWVCDPMHGNTEEVNGYKTRRYDNIRAEVSAAGPPGSRPHELLAASGGNMPAALHAPRLSPSMLPPWPGLNRRAALRLQVEAFFDVHDEVGSVPGGIHLEMTGEPCRTEHPGTQGGMLPSKKDDACRKRILQLAASLPAIMPHSHPQQWPPPSDRRQRD